MSKESLIASSIGGGEVGEGGGLESAEDAEGEGELHFWRGLLDTDRVHDRVWLKDFG